MNRFARRASPRKSLRIPVYFGVDKASLRGFIINLSSTGAAIQTNRVFAPGTELSMRVDVDKKIFRARAKIRWARKTPTSLVSRIPSMMGIEFTSLDDGFQQYLQTLQ